VTRPIVINGIEEVAIRGDLLDRGLILTLPTISQYQDESSFWERFSNARPRLLGALLDAVATALAHHETTPAPNVRMADFARFVQAAEPALGLEHGRFIQAYRDNRSGAVQLTLEASPLSEPVITLAAAGFEGTATELLAQLNALVTEETRRQRGWPKQPHTLAGRLRRLAPALRRVEIQVSFSRDRASRTITIRTDAESSVTSVTKRHQDPGVTLGDANDALSHTSSNGLTEALEQLDLGTASVAEIEAALDRSSS